MLAWCLKPVQPLIRRAGSMVRQLKFNPCLRNTGTRLS